MHENLRKKYAQKMKRMYVDGMTRKQVLYLTGIEMRNAEYPCSRSTLYRILAESRIKLR